MFEKNEKPAYRLVYYDLETTGLGFHNKHKDIEIVEIGAVDGETKDTFRQYILPPGNHIPRDASNVHGIYLREGVLYRDDKKLEAVDLKTGLQNFLRWLKDLNQPIALAGYNSHNFDDWVICHNLLREGLSVAEDGRVGKFLDVSKIVRPYLRSKLGERKWSLTFAVKTCLGRGQSDAHSAVSDAVDTLDLMVRLADEEAPEKAYNNAQDVENMCDRLAKGLPLEETKVAKEKSAKKTACVDKKQPRIQSFFTVITNQKKVELKPEVSSLNVNQKENHSVNKENVERNHPKLISKRKSKRKARVLEEVNCESHRVTRSGRKRRKMDSIPTVAELPGNVNELQFQKAPRAPRAARAPRKPRTRSLKLTPAVA